MTDYGTLIISSIGENLDGNYFGVVAAHGLERRLGQQPRLTDQLPQISYSMGGTDLLPARRSLSSK